MNESSKAITRRTHDIRFITKYFVGHGIDIGAGSDGLGSYSHIFPQMMSCRHWDLQDGDAQYLESIADNSYNFVHSSHCLEHMVNPHIALQNWIRILKPGGHIIVMIPDEDLYEQDIFPSTFNSDHKWTFTINKHRSWSPKSVSIFNLLKTFSNTITPLKIEKLDHLYDSTSDRLDQTLSPVVEAAIEFVCIKNV